MLLKLYWSLVRPPWIPISKITQRSQPENQSSLLTPPLHLFLVLSTTLLRLAKFSPNIIYPSSLFLADFLMKLLVMKTNATSLLFSCIHSCLLPSLALQTWNLIILTPLHPFSLPCGFGKMITFQHYEPFGLTPFYSYHPSSACSLHSSHNEFLSDPRTYDATSRHRTWPDSALLMFSPVSADHVSYTSHVSNACSSRISRIVSFPWGSLPWFPKSCCVSFLNRLGNL